MQTKFDPNNFHNSIQGHFIYRFWNSFIYIEAWRTACRTAHRRNCSDSWSSLAGLLARRSSNYIKICRARWYRYVNWPRSHCGSSPRAMRANRAEPSLRLRRQLNQPISTNRSNRKSPQMGTCTDSIQQIITFFESTQFWTPNQAYILIDIYTVQSHLVKWIHSSIR